MNNNNPRNNTQKKNRFISEKGINSFKTSGTCRGAHELYIMSDYLHWVMAQSLKIRMMDMCVTYMQWQILHTYKYDMHIIFFCTRPTR